MTQPAGDALLDTFTRTVGAGSVGTADDGHTYLLSPSSAFSVNGTRMLVDSNHAAPSIIKALGVNLQDSDQWIEWQYPGNPDALQSLFVCGRYVDDNNYYRVTMQVSTAGKLTAKLQSVKGGVGNTDLTSLVTVANPMTMGVVYVTHMVITGGPLPRIQAKIFKKSDGEPAGYLLDATDSSSPITAHSSVAFRASLPGTSTGTFTIQIPEWDVDNLDPVLPPPVRVPPKLIQVGADFIDQATGRAVDLTRGAGIAVQTCLSTGNTPNMFKTIKDVLHGNFLTIRVTWDDIEPTAPGGGDPASGTWVLRNYDPAFLADFLRMCQWCNDNHIFFEWRMGHTGGDGVDYFDPGNNAGWANWLYDDAAWSGGDVAPLPHFRSEYGGPYEANTGGKLNADAAMWTSTATSLTIGAHDGAGAHTWHGDRQIAFGYMLDLVKTVDAIASQFPYHIGRGLLNEQDQGALVASGLTTKQAVERMLQAGAIELFDPMRVLEPDRYDHAHGQGGRNWQMTTDMSKLWTSGVGGGGACPSDQHFLDQIHLYASWQRGLDAPDYDTTTGSPSFNQDNLPVGSVGGTTTFTTASPTVATTSGAHGLVAGDRIFFDDDGDPADDPPTSFLPTGIEYGTYYYVLASGLTSTAFKFALTPGGTPVNVTAPGAGVFTTYETPSRFAYTPVRDGDGEATYANETLGLLVNRMRDDWGIPCQMGEYGINDPTVDGPNYYDDTLRAGALVGLQSAAVFLLALSRHGGKGILTQLTDAPDDTYGLKPTIGQRLADLFAPQVVYTPTADDEGYELRAVVIARSSTSGSESVPTPTAWSEPVAGTATAPSNTVAPTIQGVVSVGNTLGVDVGAWSGSNIVFTYQWKLGGSDVPGETRDTFDIDASMIGEVVTCEVTATNGGGSDTVETAAVGPVTLDPPVNLSGPFIIAPGGALVPGMVLQADPGDWEGSRPITFQYQWYRGLGADGVFTPISGAVNETYRITQTDVGYWIEFAVTASNGV